MWRLLTLMISQETGILMNSANWATAMRPWSGNLDAAASPTPPPMRLPQAKSTSDTYNTIPAWKSDMPINCRYRVRNTSAVHGMDPTMPCKTLPSMLECVDHFSISAVLCPDRYDLICFEPSAQHSTAQHSTAQHSTAQHRTAQHSTATATKGQMPNPCMVTS